MENRNVVPKKKFRASGSGIGNSRVYLRRIFGIAGAGDI